MNKREQMLREEKIGKLLLKLSLPAIIGMMFGALYNVVDTIFVGKGVDAFAIGGLTVAFPIQMIIVSVAMMVGVGAQANISIYFGAGNIEKTNKFAGASYTLIFLISALLTVLGVIFIEPLLKLFGASPVIMPYAADYMRIIFMGTIANSLNLVNNSILRAEGNAKLSMIVMVTGTVLNIILDPIFIFAFGWGIKGAAVATVISQYTSLTIGAYFMFSGKSIIKISLANLKLRLNYVADIIILGLPTFVRQVVGSFIAIFFNNGIVNYGGDIALSAFGIVNRLMMFMMLPMFGIVQGFQPIVGFNYGANDIARVKEAVKVGIKTLFIYCLVAVTLVMIFGGSVFGIFTDNVEVAEIGAYAIRIMFLGIPIIGFQIIASSFFQSIGKSIPALVISLMRQLIILLPLLIIMPKIFGLNGIWISIPSADILSSLIGLLILKIQLKKIDKGYE